MGRLELFLSLLSGGSVGLVGLVTSLLVFGSWGVFRNVSVIVSFHFVVEDLGFWVGGLGQELVINKFEDLIAVFVQFALNFGFVTFQKVEVLWLFLLLFLLNWTESSPCCSPGTNGVLIGNWQKIPLFNGQISISTHNFIHSLKHILESLGLLCDLGHVQVFLSGICSHF